MYHYPPYLPQVNYDTINENSPRRLTQPDKIKIELKANQLSILHAARQLEENGPVKISDEEMMSTQVIIIGDKVGSGKSLSMLAIIADQIEIYKQAEVITYGKINIVRTPPIIKYYGINVLVVPHSIFKQWEGYIKKFTSLKCHYISNTSHKNFFTNKEEYMKYDLILVSSTQYNRLANYFTMHEYISRLIFDEADSINITSCKEIKASKYYFISASIPQLRYAKIPHMGFIKDVFGGLRYCPENYFKQIVLKNEDGFVERSFALMDPIRHIIKCKSPISANILVGLVNSEVIQMINAGDIEGIFFKYDMQITDDNNVVQLICKDYLSKLNNLRIKYKMKSKMTYANADNKKKALEKITEKIIDLETKVKNIEERIKNADVCGICLDEFTNKCLTPCCKNVFCFECLSMALSSRAKCPMCRGIIADLKDLIILDKDKIKSNANIKKKDEELDKLGQLQKLIENRIDENSRILIFSEYDNSFPQMLNLLDEYGISYDKIMGTGSHINNIVEKYKSGKTQCLLLNARHFGSGLNLENTTDLIIYHKMDKELKKQVEGRAQRPNRNGQLHIWELLYDNEI